MINILIYIYIPQAIDENSFDQMEQKKNKIDKSASYIECNKRSVCSWLSTVLLLKLYKVWPAPHLRTGSEARKMGRMNTFGLF